MHPTVCRKVKNTSSEGCVKCRMSKDQGTLVFPSLIIEWFLYNWLRVIKSYPNGLLLFEERVTKSLKTC